MTVDKCSEGFSYVCFSQVDNFNKIVDETGSVLFKYVNSIIRILFAARWDAQRLLKMTVL